MVRGGRGPGLFGSRGTIAMDVFFHGCAGVLLASSLGERRRLHLLAAGIVGMAPDIAFGVTALFHHTLHYNVTHSPIYNGIVFGLLLLLNWRVAMALPLHLLVDAPLHKYSGLYDWLRMPGINWYEGYGFVAWFILWAVLIGLAALHLKTRRRQRQLDEDRHQARTRQPSRSDG